MNVSEIFIRRPIATSLLMAAIAFFGIVAYRALPVSDLPTVDFPTIQIQAGLPGGEPDHDQDFQIHQGIAGKQECQIDREGLRKGQRQNDDGEEFQHAAQRQPAEEIRELHDQHFPKHVTEDKGNFVTPLSPPILHLKPPPLDSLINAAPPAPSIWRSAPHGRRWSRENRFASPAGATSSRSDPP